MLVSSCCSRTDHLCPILYLQRWQIEVSRNFCDRLLPEKWSEPSSSSTTTSTCFAQQKAASAVAPWPCLFLSSSSYALDKASHHPNWCFLLLARATRTKTVSCCLLFSYDLPPTFWGMLISISGSGTSILQAQKLSGLFLSQDHKRSLRTNLVDSKLPTVAT